MSMLIDGVYRDGVFYPTEPVELENNTRVTMKVDVQNPTSPTLDESKDDRERREVHEILVAAGAVRPGPVPGPTKSTISQKRRAELAKKLAEIGPIYDIIREERDDN